MVANDGCGSTRSGVGIMAPEIRALNAGDDEIENNELVILAKAWARHDRELRRIEQELLRRREALDAAHRTAIKALELAREGEVQVHHEAQSSPLAVFVERRFGWRMDIDDVVWHGKRVSALCRERGIECGITSHGLWPDIKTYPEKILQEYFDRHLAPRGGAPPRPAWERTGPGAQS
jgi:hypothetical protein